MQGILINILCACQHLNWTSLWLFGALHFCWVELPSGCSWFPSPAARRAKGPSDRHLQKPLLTQPLEIRLRHSSAHQWGGALSSSRGEGWRVPREGPGAWMRYHQERDAEIGGACMLHTSLWNQGCSCAFGEWIGTFSVVCYLVIVQTVWNPG